MVPPFARPFRTVNRKAGFLSVFNDQTFHISAERDLNWFLDLAQLLLSNFYLSNTLK